MSKKLRDAALALADEACASVEYSDWPELQKAIQDVHIAVKNESSTSVSYACEIAFRLAVRLSAYQPPRLSLHEDNPDDGVICCLTWMDPAGIGLLVAMSNNGEASYAMKTPQGVSERKEFMANDTVPADLENFLKLHFSSNITLQ